MSLFITSGTITAQFKQKEELVINISIVQRVKATGEKVVAPITAIYDNGNGDKGYFNKDNNDNFVATVKDLRNNGNTINEISLKTGVPISSVYRYIKLNKTNI